MSYTLSIKGNEPLANNDLLKLLNNEIIDGILCVRFTDGTSTIVKGEMEVEMECEKIISVNKSISSN